MLRRGLGFCFLNEKKDPAGFYYDLPAHTRTEGTALQPSSFPGSQAVQIIFASLVLEDKQSFSCV